MNYYSYYYYYYYCYCCYRYCCYCCDCYCYCCCCYDYSTTTVLVDPASALRPLLDAAAMLNVARAMQEWRSHSWLRARGEHDHDLLPQRQLVVPIDLRQICGIHVVAWSGAHFNSVTHPRPANPRQIPSNPCQFQNSLKPITAAKSTSLDHRLDAWCDRRIAAVRPSPVMSGGAWLRALEPGAAALAAPAQGPELKQKNPYHSSK